MPSNESKQRWNAAHYTQVKVSVSPETAAAFKDACAAAGCSMAGVLTQLMAEYSRKAVPDKSAADPYKTRRLRRNAMNTIIAQAEQLLQAEERYMDNIPENLQSSKRYDNAEQCVSILSEAIDLLREIY